MQVIIANTGGFCSGVKKAVETALNVPPENTFVYGEIIHNKSVVEEIALRGIVTVDDVSSVPDGATLLIRSHGAVKSVYEECAQRNIRLIDCTCAFVKKSREIVKRASDEGKTVVITGSRDHPEIRGLVGWTSGEVYVFASETEDFGVLKDKEVVLISQTTFSEKSFSKIADFSDDLLYYNK